MGDPQKPWLALLETGALPYRAATEDPGSLMVQPEWRDLLEKSICPAHVDLMLQGHDHDLEWLKPVKECGRTEFVTSGAGGAELTGFYNNVDPIWFQRAGRYGFFWFEVTAEKLKGIAFTLDASNAPQKAFERVLKH